MVVIDAWHFVPFLSRAQTITNYFFNEIEPNYCSVFQQNGIHFMVPFNTYLLQFTNIFLGFIVSRCHHPVRNILRKTNNVIEL